MVVAGRVDDPGGTHAQVRGWAAPMERIDRIEVRFEGGAGVLAPRASTRRDDLVDAAPGFGAVLCGFEVQPPMGATGGAAVRIVVDGVAEPLVGSAPTTGAWSVPPAVGPQIRLGPRRRPGRIDGLARSGLEQRWPVIVCSGTITPPGSLAEVLLALARIVPVLPDPAVVLLGALPSDGYGWDPTTELVTALASERWLRVAPVAAAVDWAAIADVVVDADGGGPCDVSVVAHRLHAAVLSGRWRWPLAGVDRRRRRRTTSTTNVR